MSVRRAMFEPMVVPKARIGFLSKAEVMPTTVSGSEVAVAMSNALIVYSEIPK